MYLWSLRFVLFGLILIGILLGTPRVARNEQEYVLGVVPFMPPEQLEPTFARLAASLTAAVDRPVRFQTSSSQERFLEQLTAGTYDIAIVDPFAVVHIDRDAYAPLARAPGPSVAVFVAAPGSSVRVLADLKGSEIAVGQRGSSIDYLVRHTLAEAGMEPDDDVTLIYFRGQFSCLQQVMAGKLSACVTSPSPLAQFERTRDVDLVVLTESPPIPAPAAVTHRRLPAHHRDAMRRVFLSDLPAPIPTFVPAAFEDYEPVERIWQSLKAR